MTRCKAGDLALVVAAGHLVEVVRAATPADVAQWEPNSWWCKSLGSPIETYGFAGLVFLAAERAFRDSDLRPIRPDNGVDETLTWAGKPEGVTS